MGKVLIGIVIRVFITIVLSLLLFKIDGTENIGGTVLIVGLVYGYVSYYGIGLKLIMKMKEEDDARDRERGYRIVYKYRSFIGDFLLLALKYVIVPMLFCLLVIEGPMTLLELVLSEHVVGSIKPVYRICILLVPLILDAVNIKKAMNAPIAETEEENVL